MKTFAKKFLSNDFLLPLTGGKRFIFVYHDVSDQAEKHFSGEHYSTTVDNFKRQILFLAKKFEFLPLDILVKDSNLSRKKHYASIVFDDGFLSVTERARPILDAEQIPFAVFVNKSAVLFNQLWISNLVLRDGDESYLRKLYGCLTDSGIAYEKFAADPINTIIAHGAFDSRFRELYLLPADRNEKRIYLNAGEVKQLHDEGVLIGSHSTEHYRLNKCGEKELSTQIDENRDFLKDLLKTDIEHFAVPYGKKEHYDANVIKKLFAAGHRFVHSTNVMSFGSKETEQSGFLFPRIVIFNNRPEEIMFYINRTFLRKYDI